MKSTSVWLVSLIAVMVGPVLAENPATDPRIALDSSFPDAKAATYFAGEITLVEHVNRKGILRLDRDGTINKFHWDLPHHFQMLPYGAIAYHGASAELKHIPIGTHLHGLFYLGPEGAFEVTPPVSGYVAGKMTRPDLRSVESQFSRVLLLEDDFSFYQRQGAGWRIRAISEEPWQLTVERVLLETGAPDTRKDMLGLTGEQVFRLDEGTRVWKGRSITSLEALEKDQIVQLNLGWVSMLGSYDQDGICREIWIDETSREVAAELQRGRYIAHQKRRGVPAMVLRTESMPGEGARGHMTVQLCAGIDPVLLDAIQNAKSVLVQAVEPSLRAYDRGDVKPASQLEVTLLEDPPAGSSGIQIRMHLYEMLEGFREGRTVRMALNEWDMPDRPREEKLWQKDIRIFSVGPKPVADRE